MVIQKLKMPDARCHINSRNQRNSIVTFEISLQYASRSETARSETKKRLINLACSCSICIEFTKIENWIIRVIASLARFTILSWFRLKSAFEMHQDLIKRHRIRKYWWLIYCDARASVYRKSQTGDWFGPQHTRHLQHLKRLRCDETAWPSQNLEIQWKNLWTACRTNYSKLRADCNHPTIELIVTITTIERRCIFDFWKLRTQIEFRVEM